MAGDLDFSGKTVLVVGGSSGIGNGIAHGFRERGAQVHVWGTRSDPADYDPADPSHVGLIKALVAFIRRAIPLEERQRLLEEKNRAKSDAQLLRLYGTPEDIERARARKLQELDGVISVARANLQSLRTQQANLQSQAADHERAGRAVPEHLLAQIDNLKAEQRRVRSDIQRFSDNRRQVDAEFLRDKARLVELWSR